MIIPTIPSQEGNMRLLLDKIFAILSATEQDGQQELTDGFGQKFKKAAAKAILKKNGLIQPKTNPSDK